MIETEPNLRSLRSKGQFLIQWNLNHDRPFTSATTEEAQGFVSKVTFSKLVCSYGKKDEVCLSLLVEIFTKSFLVGGVKLLYIQTMYTLLDKRKYIHTYLRII